MLLRRFKNRKERGDGGGRGEMGARERVCLEGGMSPPGLEQGSSVFRIAYGKL